MSIKSPNFDNLPRVAAAKSQEKRILKKVEQTISSAIERLVPPEPENRQLGRARGTNRVPNTRRATCHPGRAEVSQGLCRWCLEKRINRADRAALTPEKALEKVVAEGEDTVGKKTRAYMLANLPEYASLHLEATRIAALAGDAKPAEWALSHIKAGDQAIVPPAAKEGSGGSGIKVLIGVQLGGLPPGIAQTAITVSEGVTTDPPADTN